MNYIAEIKAFYDLVQIKQLSTGQIALWHALMAINNKCAWIEWFTVPNITLELNTGMSRSGVLKARNSLKQYGLIDFKVNGTKATSYKIITIAKSKQDGVQDGTQDSTQVSKQDGVQVSNTLNKLNETKLNEKKNKKKKETELDKLINQNFSNEELKNTVYEFIKMRKAIKKPLTTKGLELMIKKLYKLTNNVGEQIEILNNSIMNNWQGIFLIKKENVTTTKKDNIEEWLNGTS